MRQRTAGLIALGAGVFLLVTAALLRFYAVPTLEVLPKDYWTHYKATGVGSAFDARPSAAKTVDGLNITQDITIKGMGDNTPKDAPPNSVVWQYASELSFATDKACNTDDSNNKFSGLQCPLSWSNEVAAFDKKTGLSLPWRGDVVDNGANQPGGVPVNQATPHHVGYVSKFDFDTGKKDQPLWDDTLSNANGDIQPPAKYVGTRQISDKDGKNTITAYEFKQTIGTPQQPVHVYSRTDIPPLLVNTLGMPTGTPVPVYEYSETYADVDPTSGIPVAGHQHIVLTAGPVDGTEPTYLTLLNVDLKLDKVQVTDSNDVPQFDSNNQPKWTYYTDQALRDARNADRITLVKNTLPLTGLIAGGLLLLLGIFLIVRDETAFRRGAPAHAAEPEETDPAKAPTRPLPATGGEDEE